MVIFWVVVGMSAKFYSFEGAYWFVVLRAHEPFPIGLQRRARDCMQFTFVNRILIFSRSRTTSAKNAGEGYISSKTVYSSSFRCNRKMPDSHKWIIVWAGISSLIVLWDAGYCFTRPWRVSDIISVVCSTLVRHWRVGFGVGFLVWLIRL
ncbi:hypothetical protein FRC18_005766 [Serendipita sp. 400]|nr:hypothetical protein FRC18_005766 [Serendipita sp. 400]